MRYTLLIAVLALGACNKTHSSSGASPVISSRGPDVRIKDVPAGAVLTGNIDGLLPVLFGVTVVSPIVYIKVADSDPWRVLGALQKDQPTYVYDVAGKQLRFQWCEEGWAYAVVPGGL